jgi:hypothetical protein
VWNDWRLRFDRGLFLSYEAGFNVDNVMKKGRILSDAATV